MVDQLLDILHESDSQTLEALGLTTQPAPTPTMNLISQHDEATSSDTIIVDIENMEEDLSMIELQNEQTYETEEAEQPEFESMI